MPKDYKDAPAPRGDSRLNHPLLLGVIIGLLLGIVISLAVALWLNRLSNPFVEKNKSVEPLPKMGPAQPPPPPEAAKAAEKNAKGVTAEKGAPAAKPSERPRFEFYQILPGEKEGTPDREAKAQPKAASPAPEAPPRPGSSPATPKPHTGDVYWLQAGAFAEEKEADNLRAKIALTGLEASVRSVATGDKGKLYRVRLGPYQSLDDANRIKVALSQNGVSAAIIPESKSP
jgi:cell division protein FtsN